VELTHHQLSTRVGFGRRLAAAVIDGLAMYVLYAVSVLIPTRWDAVSSPLLTVALMMLAGGVLMVAYAGIEAVRGAALGKLLLKMRIANEDGSEAGVPRLLLRAMLKFLPLILTFFALPVVLLLDSWIEGLANAQIVTGVAVLVGMVWLSVLGGFCLSLGPSRQALHDVIADTAVYPVDTLKMGRGFEPVSKR
jgi:uncharacterized RDD family membrane protein YckC